MADHESTRTGYTMGYDEDFRQMLDRRSAATHAKHLLPHLQPGMSVLDFGCGPGTISLGMASAVEPGRFVGIDMADSQIELARKAAVAGGHHNASFRVGNVTDLAFDNDTFDVVHCHAVLNHVPDTRAALQEAKRVLKPGGIISCRELIGESSFSEPAGNLSEAWEVFTKLIEANGGHPQMGKELKAYLVDAGFTNVAITASIEVYSTPEDIAFFHKLVADWFFSPKLIAAATMFGLATHEQFEKWREDHDAWRDAPGAVGGTAFGEAIAFKP